jgi:imidazoleglycerol phosphate dehydratase HisB
VATGANAFAELSEAAFTARTYTRFVPGRVRLELGDVTAKALDTPNDFVSHMIEHVAWRLGCSVELLWTSDDWHALGAALGGQIGALPRLRESAAALGMIDDGSCLVELTRTGGTGSVILAASEQVDLAWFLGLRCEQLANGGPLVAVLEGLAEGSGWDMRITVASLEDTHHTWEGIFRGVGIALDRTVRAARGPTHASAPNGHDAEAVGVSNGDPAAALPLATNGDRAEPSPAEAQLERGWRVLAASPSGARLRRETAESEVGVEVALAFGEAAGARCRVDVADSIDVAGVEELLARLAIGAGLGIAIDFRATRLSSSHVVLEDIGLALGRALRLLAVERMESTGIEGAGSNVDRVESLAEQPIRVGVSMEGRKFWRFVPFAETYEDFRHRFLLGHTLGSGLFSEDLDDFVDGLAGGLQASVMIHVAERVEPETGWAQVFSALGEAIGELLSVNESRRSLTPGVKATLA